MSTHSHDIDFKKAFTVTKAEGSQVVIEGEIPFEELEKERTKAIAHFSKDMQVDGFRPGHVPEKVVVERIGEMALLTEMSERALAHCYPHILEAHDIDAIGYPKIEITKIAPQNPLGFKATVAVMPTITLPDYKSIAAKVNKEKTSTEVTDEEVETQIKDIQRQKIAYDRLQAKAASNTEDSTMTPEDGIELPTPESVAEEAEADPDKIEVPELTDAYVATLGQPGQFTSVADFKTKIKEHLAVEKEREVHATHRAKITDAIIEETKVELPSVLVESELSQMLAQMEEDLRRMNLSIDDYLKHIKKTKEELTKEWTPAAEKRATLQLVLNEIARKENITPDAALVTEQVAALKERYADADSKRVQVYVESILQNEAVMKSLEEQG
jgi:trigger factor